MKQLLSTIAGLALLLCLGLLVSLARPVGLESASLVVGQHALEAAAVVVSASPAAAPDATLNWSAIALPLEVDIDIDDDGKNEADEVAYYIQSFCPVENPPCPTAIQKVARWRDELQRWQTDEVGILWNPDNFEVTLGMPLLLAATSAAAGLNGDEADSFAWTGWVPDEGGIQYTIGAGQWTFLMIPLDQSIGGTPADADALAASIGPGVTKVAQWRSDVQRWQTDEVGILWNPDNFAVSIGHPYFVYSTTAYCWP